MKKVRGETSAPPELLRSFARALLTWSVPALAVLLLDGPVVAAVIVVVFGPAAIPGLRRDLGDLVTGTHVVYIGDVADEIDAVDDKEIPA